MERGRWLRFEPYSNGLRTEFDSMRVLSIGHPLPNPAVDNHSIFSAPTVFDYEAIMVDPGGVFDGIQAVIDASAEQFTHADVPVVNGETSAVATGIADVLRRRRDEFARALERGAVVALFTYPQATLTAVSGFSGCDRYFFLPAPPGMGWDAELLRGGEGTAAAVVDHAHPFAPVVDALRPELLYRAYFDDRAPGFAGAARVFARSAGGAPIGVQFAVGGGTVVFLPARKTGGSPPSALAGAVVEAMHELLGVEQAERPGWLARQELPGLVELEEEAATAGQRREAADSALEAAEQAVAELAQVRDVLWRGGEHGLLPAVLRCMTLLGFEEASDDPSREPPVLRSPEGDLQLVVAASQGAVDMTPHYRLRQRLDAVIAQERRAARGVVVVNGERLSPPERREAQYEDSLRVAAESTRYALLTATELFAAARCALEGADEETLAAIRRRLVETDGPVELTDPVGEEHSGEQAGGEEMRSVAGGGGE